MKVTIIYNFIYKAININFLIIYFTILLILQYIDFTILFIEKIY